MLIQLILLVLLEECHSLPLVTSKIKDDKSLLPKFQRPTPNEDSEKDVNIAIEICEFFHSPGKDGLIRIADHLVPMVNKICEKLIGKSLLPLPEEMENA